MHDERNIHMNQWGDEAITAPVGLLKGKSVPSYGTSNLGEVSRNKPISPYLQSDFEWETVLGTTPIVFLEGSDIP
jgi:hypothetical protein